MRILLLPISFLYHIVLTIRHKLYDWHILKATQFEKPVICVGNLSLGGTGKTPHTEYLISLLKDDYHVATLSRGYGRKTKGFKLAESISTCEDLGDEPLLYFRKFPQILVAVDEDRVDGTRKLLCSPNRAEVVLLDDAFQHRPIKAGLNILLTEYQHLYCDDFLFPTGTLRDVRSAAKRAQIIIVSKSPKCLREEDKKRVINKLKHEENQKVFFSYLEYNELQPLNEKAKTVASENADSVLAFCGIANPKPFVEELKNNYKSVDFLQFADTEKDAARLTNSPYFCQFEIAPLYVLPINVRFHEKEKFNEEILKYVRENSYNRWLH